MGIVVRELFAEFGAKYQMRLLAGEKGLNRVMDWVHILEDVEAAKFLNGNELIFTTGIGKNMEHWLMCLIQGIYQRNACGMIVNIGPYIEEIPEEVIQFCEKKAFPVFSVPWKVHLVDMTRDFSTRVNEKEFEELNLTEAVRNAIFYSSQPNTYLPYMKRGGYNEKEKFQAAVFYLQADVRQFPDMRFRNRLIRSRIGNDQKKTVMFDQEGLVVLIFFGEDVEKSQEAMESLADFAASRNLEFSGGMGEIVTAAEEIVKTYEQAVQARRLAQVKRKKFLYYGELGAYRLILGCSDQVFLKNFAKEKLGCLLEDEKEKENRKILRDYLESGCSVSAVAQEHFCHRNTVTYRLNRISQLLGINMESMKEKEELMLAFQILDCVGEEDT